MPRRSTLAPAGGTYGTATKVAVTVTDENGEPVAGSVTLSGAGPAVTGTLAAGRAQILVPRTVRPGRYAVTASYSGSPTHLVSVRTGTLQIAKGVTMRPTIKVAKVPTPGRMGAARIRVQPQPGLVAPHGKVTVIMTKGKVTKRVTAVVRNGSTFTVRLPKVAAGRWQVQVSYLGDATYRAATSTKVKVTVRSGSRP